MRIGTDLPDPAAQLEIKSTNRDLLIPRIRSTSNTGQSTISAGHIEILLIYNTTSKATLNQGFYYCYNNKWRRLPDDNDLHDNIVIWEEVNNQFTYIDQNGDSPFIEIDLQETLTHLSLNPDGKTLEYIDEKSNLTQIDFEEIIHNNKSSFTLIDGETTQIEISQTGNHTQYQINVPIAKGAHDNTTSNYGEVTESVENPSVAISQQGELSVNLENLKSVKIVNQDYTAESKDRVILGSANIGTLTFTLPDPITHKGKKYMITKEDFTDAGPASGQVINVKLSGVEEASNYLNINDATGPLTYGAMPHQAWIFKSNGNNWQIVGKS